MALRLKKVDRDTPMLLPPDLRAWVPEGHIVHFILDAVSRLPEERFSFNWKGSGSEQYPPQMMLSLLIYSYCTGRFSSRVIEEASYSDVVIRYVCGGDHHPDHDTICAFRRQNRKVFESAFLEVLLLAGELKGLKKVGTVSVDGTKIKANASKHAAVSYKRAGEQIEMLQKEVEKLVAKAEERDKRPLDEGLSIPKEIQRREDRIARLEEARNVIEQRYKEELEEKQKTYEAKMSQRKQARESGKKPRGRAPGKPSKETPGNKQYNFTDPESRIMKSADGYVQAYNAQAVVDTESMLVVGQRVSDAPNDKRELDKDLASVPEVIENPDAVLTDSGFYSEEMVEKLEEDDGPIIYASVGKQHHHMSVEDLEKREDPPAPGRDEPMAEQMMHRLRTRRGRELYKLRKQTVEPVFGIIKEAMGFRRFSMRGRKKAEIEWCLVCLGYNIKRLFNLQGGSAQIWRPRAVAG